MNDYFHSVFSVNSVACFGDERIAVDINIKVHIPTFIERPAVLLLLIYRRLRYGYAFRRIPLTKGYYAIVDVEDYDRLRIYKWHVVVKNSPYAARNSPTGKGGKYQKIWMHREVMPAPKGMVVDHINHNTLDNRWVNLRPATKLQNMYNRSKRKNTSSRYKGVHWHEYAKKWRAGIRVNGRDKALGYFESELEAAKAYDRAARKHQKEFAVPNLP
jgi:hypothetical protein